MENTKTKKSPKGGLIVKLKDSGIKIAGATVGYIAGSGVDKGVDFLASKAAPSLPSHKIYPAIKGGVSFTLGVVLALSSDKISKGAFGDMLQGVGVGLAAKGLSSSIEGVKEHGVSGVAYTPRLYERPASTVYISAPSNRYDAIPEKATMEAVY